MGDVVKDGDHLELKLVKKVSSNKKICCECLGRRRKDEKKKVGLLLNGTRDFATLDKGTECLNIFFLYFCFQSYDFQCGLPRPYQHSL